MTKKIVWEWHCESGLVSVEVLRWCRSNLTGLWRYDGYETLVFFEELDYALFLVRWS